MTRLLTIGLALAALSACSTLSDVQGNLNDQRAIYELEPVFGETCADVAAGFEDYAPMVTTAVPADDPAWETITASECRTLGAHMSAFEAFCEPWSPDAETMEACARAGVEL